MSYLYYLVYCLLILNLSFSIVSTSVGEERAMVFLLSVTHIVVVSVRRSSSSSGCLGKVVVF